MINTLCYFPKGTRQRGSRMEVFQGWTVDDVFWAEKYLSKPIERHSQPLRDLPNIQMVLEAWWGREHRTFILEIICLIYYSGWKPPAQNEFVSNPFGSRILHFDFQQCCNASANRATKSERDTNDKDYKVSQLALDLTTAEKKYY